MELYINDRQELLLEEIAKEYIETAQPVGSRLLVDRYHSDLSSATIRNDMVALEKAGLVEQPYTSAGRVPTEKGYQYLLKNVDYGAVPNSREKKDIIDSLHEDLEHEVRTKQMAKNLAKLSNNAVFVGFRPNDVYYTGLSYLFAQPEFAEQAQVLNISEVVDHLDEVMSDISVLLEKSVEIRLGNSNPFGRECGIVVGRFQDQGVFGVLGPMRMDYEANVARVNYVREILGGGSFYE